jgi:hypothetical protein
MADPRRPGRRTRHDPQPAARATSRPRWWGPRPVMWAAIALSLVLFGLLAGLGWGDNSAASLAGGLLLLACVAVCIWAAVQSRTAEREVDRAVGQIARLRRGQRPERH